MLAHVNFPLTNSQLTDFFLDHEYTTYFTLQQALNELREAGLIKMETIHNSSRYEITKEGDDTLSFFGNNVSSAIITDIDTYLKENKFRLRSEVGVISDFYKSTNQDYIVHCEVREGKASLISLDISVPDKDQAEIMCGHWKDKSQEKRKIKIKKPCVEKAFLPPLRTFLFQVSRTFDCRCHFFDQLPYLVTPLL